MANAAARIAQLEAELRRACAEIARRDHALAEAHEQRTATAEILRVIASSASGPTQVLDAIASTAARLTDSEGAAIQQVFGERLRWVGQFGRARQGAETAEAGGHHGNPISAGTMSGRALLERRTVHVPDVAAVVEADFPESYPVYRLIQQRSQVTTPLLRDGQAIGLLGVFRWTLRPFTDHQVALLETFADQAVIAIENARLFEELQQRNSEFQESNRQVTEALEQQTATAEVLRVIASSPTDLERVISMVAETARRLCEADSAAVLTQIEGDLRILGGSFSERLTQGLRAWRVNNGGQPLPFDRRSVSARACIDGRTVNVGNLIMAADDFPMSSAQAQAVGHRAQVSAPLRRGHDVLGVISLYSTEPNAFGEHEIALLETFADQAVIAIENVRLFRELADLNRTLEARVDQQVEELERVGRLRRYLSPQLADLIISSGDESILESHRRQITVVFCDLRGFTAFAETAEPEEVMAVLAEYYEALGALVRAADGTLDHFAGDGMMVFFNDPLPQPDHAERAVRLACAMRERAADLARGWRRAGHELGFGVGVAAGYATLGRIGFEGRYDYTAIGSVANLAARLCGEAQGGQILVPARLFGMVEDVIDAEPIGALTLKGFHRTVEALNVTSLRNEHIDAG